MEGIHGFLLRNPPLKLCQLPVRRQHPIRLQDRTILSTVQPGQEQSAPRGVPHELDLLLPL